MNNRYLRLKKIAETAGALTVFCRRPSQPNEALEIAVANSFVMECPKAYISPLTPLHCDIGLVGSASKLAVVFHYSLAFDYFDASSKWTSADKEFFSTRWKVSAERFWSLDDIVYTPPGRKVKAKQKVALLFVVSINDGEPHWRFKVGRDNPDEASNPKNGSIDFGSRTGIIYASDTSAFLDILPGAPMNFMHMRCLKSFGFMIGNKTEVSVSDPESIMNRGMARRTQHYNLTKRIVEKLLSEYDAEIAKEQEALRLPTRSASKPSINPLPRGMARALIRRNVNSTA